MRIPLINGVLADEDGDFRTAYPENMMPIIKKTGATNGYLRPAPGAVKVNDGPGFSRGAIRWNDVEYRVLGTKLCRVESSGVINELGTIPGADLVSMDYSFDRLCVVGDGKAWYWDGTTFTQITDPDLGVPKDVTWVDGYFMFLDDENIIVTELVDPTDIDPLKYGSSEVDPDDLKAVIKVRNEPYVLNRFSVEVFDNIGGTVFPFQRIEGAQITKGALGTHTCCLFEDAVAFLGSGRGEPPAIYIGANGSHSKISTREIDEIIHEFTEHQLAASLMEAVVDKNNALLMLHLPDRTLVYDARGSQAAGEPVWSIRHSSPTHDTRSKYRLNHFVWCYDRWGVADSNGTNVGYIDESISSHWTSHVTWSITTQILYNEGKGGIIHDLELESLTGRTVFGEDPVIYTQYTNDTGWSSLKGIKAGKTGERQKRLVWLNQGPIRKKRIQRIKGDSKSHISPYILQAQIEPLAV